MGAKCNINFTGTELFSAGQIKKALRFHPFYIIRGTFSKIEA